MVLGDFVDATRVGVSDLRSGARFLPEPLSPRRISVKFANDFQRDDALETLILGFVHNAHAAFVDFRQNAVWPDALGQLDGRHFL